MNAIGQLQEKSLHAAIKTYLCPDTDYHERPVADMLAADGEPTRGRRVADVLLDGRIFEVQTGSFFPLREKIAWYLAHTPCRVTVVHPIPAVKYLSWIDPASGDLLSRRRSPKRGRVQDVARELYWVSDFIGNSRFSVRLLLMEMEEYRIADGYGREGKRGSSRHERIATAVLEDVTLATAEDYRAAFLPAALATTGEDGRPLPFTAATYAKAIGIRGRPVYGMLSVLLSLGLIAQCEEKIGRSRAYVAIL